MDPSILATRNAIVRQDILEVCRALVELYKLDPALGEALTVAGNDPDVRRLRELEAVRAVLKALPAPEAKKTR